MSTNPSDSKKNSSKLYGALRSLVTTIGIEKFIDDVLARIGNQDRMIRLNNEILYQSIFLEFCRQKNINTMFYPVGGGANYSLLYLLARICCENSINKILELGSGQSTLLLDAINKFNHAQLTSLESSKFWADEISKKTKSKISVAELVSYPVDGLDILGYSIDSLNTTDRFDFVIVDGPTGVKRYSRFGVTEIVRNHLEDEFIIVFDDAERDGEIETIAYCKKLLFTRGIKVHQHEIIGTSSQIVLTTQKYAKVRYY